MKKLVTFFNRIDPWILSFLIPTLFFAGNTLIYNEEQYFSYAKAFMDPQWMKDSFVYTDFAGTRIVFQWITGFFLRFISFEQMALWGRLVGFLLLSFPVAALAKFFRLNNFLLSFWLIILFIPQQNFFGGEWVYGGFESKVISYVFIFWSLIFLFRKKYFLSVILGATSVYWHMLAGGWYCIYLFIFLVPEMLRNRKIFIYFCLAGILLLPFMIYIYYGLMSGNPNQINGISASYIYTYIRNPQHIGLFKNMHYFLSYHAGKVLMAMIALLISIFLYRRFLPEFLKPVNKLLIIVLLQNLVFLVVAYFDKNGIILKTYPFRGSTLAMMLFQLETMVIIRNGVISQLLINKLKDNPFRIYNLQMTAILGILILLLAVKTYGRISEFSKNNALRNYQDSIALAINSNSSDSESFLLLCQEMPLLSLPRKSERDSYFYARFIPTADSAIYEWYRRMKLQERIKNNPVLLLSPENDCKSTTLISDSALNYDFLKLITKAGPYYLYKINR